MKNKQILKIIFVFMLTIGSGTTLFATTLEHEPYLQNATPSSMVVRWRTDIKTDSKVSYGKSLNNVSHSKSNDEETYNHEIKITGLEPNTKYYYSVGSSSETLVNLDNEHYFETSPQQGTEKPTRIWILGDSGTANSDARSVRDAYYNYSGNDKTDIMLMLGDNAYDDGTDEEYTNAVFKMYSSMMRNTPLWSTIGNHETHDDNANSENQSGVYYNVFTLPKNGESGGLASGTEAYYSFDYANIHFVCLNSEDISREQNGQMLTWLKNDLEETTQEWIIAFWHHPPYSKGSHDSDDEEQLIEMRENALPILEAHGVDLVLSGHSHGYERSYLLNGHYGDSNSLTEAMKIDSGDGKSDGDGTYIKENTKKGAVYIVAGSSGYADPAMGKHPAMFVSLAKLGSMVLDVNGKTLDAKFLGEDGKIRDHFSMKKSGTTTPPSTNTQVQTLLPTGDIKDKTPTFTWNSVNNADLYELGVENNAGGEWKSYSITSAQANCTNQGQICSYKPTDLGLTVGDKKVWWVRAKVGNNFKAWSTDRKFSVIDDIRNGDTLYVSTSGSNSNNGEQNKPFATITFASEKAKAGDTIIIKSGTYSENVKIMRSGTADKPITFMGETGAIINGASIDLSNGGDANGLFEVSGQSHIHIENITIKNSNHHGIAINSGNKSHVSHISIKNCKIIDIDGAGILAYGSYPFNGYKMSHIIIDNNTLIRTQKGVFTGNHRYHENLTVGGGVENFSIINNHVNAEDVEHESGAPLGIDVKDGVRNGNIINNTVENIPSSGIYVDGFYDGAYNIEILNNSVNNVNGYGIDIASERGGAIQNIVVKNNTISHTQFSGIVVTDFINHAFNGTPLHEPMLKKENINISENYIDNVALVNNGYSKGILISDPKADGIISNNTFGGNVPTPHTIVHSGNFNIQSNQYNGSELIINDGSGVLNGSHTEIP